MATIIQVPDKVRPSPPRLAPDPELVDALLERYRTLGDRAARNELVELFIPLAEHLARRFSRRHVSVDDLCQVGLVAIIRAIDRFESAREVRLSTYLSRCVEGELKRYHRDRTWAVRPSRRAQELFLETRAAEDQLTQDLGRLPTVEDLAHRLQVSVDAALEALEAGQLHHLTSIDRPREDGQRTDPASTETGFLAVERRVDLAAALEQLPAGQRRLLHMRFVESRSQADIAQAFGVSQSFISRELCNALADLRRHLGTGANP